MNKVKKHSTKKWEVSVMELQNYIGKKFKVTRRIPELLVSDTKIYISEYDKYD